MAKLTGWLTIDRLNGGGNAIVTLDASAFTELGERNASLKIKTSSKDVIVNINQKHYEEPLIPDNIPNNQIWAKSTDGTALSFYSSAKPFEYDVVKKELRTDGWTIFTFAGDITYIPQQAFQTKEKLQEVVIPKSITSIGVNAFNKCYSLESIAIPDSVISIGANAFNDCWGLKTIYIGSGLAEVDDLFLKETNLEIISVSPNNTVFDSRENCNCLIRTATNSVIKGTPNSFIPNTVVEISSYAFYGLGITSIVVPNSVKYIQNYAFQESDLTSITLGSGLTYIGMRAFERCPLTTITSYAITAPTLNESVFTLVSSNGVLYYPSGATGYDVWLSSGYGYLGYYNWTGSPTA